MAVVVFALLAVGCGSTSTASPSTSVRATPHARARGPSWIITTGFLPRLVAAGLSLEALDRDFDNTNTLLLGQGRVDAMAPRASPVMVFTSASALIDALDDNSVPGQVTWLLLDLEDWPLTPTAEQADPIGALREAVAATHAHGRKVMFTPAVDLLTVLAPDTPPLLCSARFDQLVVEPGAVVVDGFEVQSQQTEGSSQAVPFVSAAIATARKAKPAGLVLAGLSTNPDGRLVSVSDLLVVYRAAIAAGASGSTFPRPAPSAPDAACRRPR
jgi:hypothetical protein